MAALIKAAEEGKEVTVVVELKARFDEEPNIRWARRLQDAGVYVVYGVVGLKTHCKLSMIVRREADGLRRYAHIGTGNYNPATARIYTDVGLMTIREDITSDVAEVFNLLTTQSNKPELKKLLVAPFTMMDRILGLIEGEAEHAKAGRPARIVAKMNGLDDVGVIRQLYRASQKGVQVDLIVRGHSRLRPGLAGYSDNIRVISIVGRFLEHDRIYYFYNKDQPLVYIGSADWRNRNLKSRVELITPIEEPALRERIITILDDALRDDQLAWDLDSEGAYHLRHAANKKNGRNFHELLMKQARKRAKEE